jgi:uncharacterized protein (DUF1697 family)
VKTYVAMLRGINLGSRNKVAMAELRALVEALGAAEVKTYVQSGNVVFKMPAQSAPKLEKILKDRIKKEFGLDVPVVVRTKEQLTKVWDNNPFTAKTKDAKALHVTFLAGKADPKGAKEVTAKDWAPDELAVKGTEVYLLCPNGYGVSKLGNAFLEKKLGATATTRNWNTVTNLVEMASD